MFGAEQYLGSPVVLGDHLLGHVSAPVLLLNSEMEIWGERDDVSKVCLLWVTQT